MRDVHFEKLTKRAIATYTLERKALLSGDPAALEKAKAEKAQLLKDLDTIEAQVRQAPTCVATDRNLEGLASLLSIIARRTAENEQLARANRPTGSNDQGKTALG